MFLTAMPTKNEHAPEQSARPWIPQVSAHLLGSCSAGHAGHLHLVAAKGRARDGVESHFKVTVVSPAFEGVRPVQRHRMVYEALAVEMAGPLHALQLETLTPAEAGD